MGAAQRAFKLDVLSLKRDALVPSTALHDADEWPFRCWMYLDHSPVGDGLGYVTAPRPEVRLSELSQQPQGCTFSTAEAGIFDNLDVLECPMSDEPRENIGRSTGGERYDNCDTMSWVFL